VVVVLAVVLAMMRSPKRNDVAGGGPVLMMLMTLVVVGCEKTCVPTIAASKSPRETTTSRSATVWSRALVFRGTSRRGSADGLAASNHP